ncbi:MAG TPA: ArsR family transcriptional regulator [Candidatus Kapabacteria bacterium]|nr:ArsR family transcriptional regulator [Candidatus Kapabacteria bacterium]
MNILDSAGVAASFFAAHRAGLIGAILDSPASCSELASRLGIDRNATGLILDVLRSAGLVEHDGEAYAASAELHAAHTRLPGGVDALMMIWTHTPEFLASGAPLRRMDGTSAERAEEYENLVLGLASLFMPSARELARRLEGAPRRILDVGAGSGIWSLAIAEAHPGSTVTALDFPPVLESFGRQAAAMGLADRVDVLAGDAYIAEIPEGAFDLIVLANILHLEPAERAAVLLHRVADVLAPGGRIVVVDVFGGEGDADRGRAVYALHLAMRTERGTAHPAALVESWLHQAGVGPELRMQFNDPMVYGMGALVSAPASGVLEAPAAGSLQHAASIVKP